MIPNNEPLPARVRDPRTSPAHVWAWWGRLGLLAFGILWLAFSVEAGLNRRYADDIHRRWVVYQYVLADVDPYPIARVALEKEYGPLAEVRLGDHKIAKVPPLSPDELATIAPELATPAALRLVAAHGPPESVYPPSANFLLASALGRLPESWINPCWMLCNLALLLACGWLLGTDLASAAPPGGRGTLVPLTLLLLWAPVHTTLFSSQFALGLTACLVLSCRFMPTHGFLSGLFLSIALIKPSLSLPFLILPLVRLQWRVLATVVFVHGVGTLCQSLQFGVAPWTLLGQWLGVGGYFTQSMYTLQEYVNALHLDNSLLSRALTLGLLAAVLGWAWVNRRAGDAALFDWLCFVSIFWTYHNNYDFVILLVPVARLAYRCWPRGGWSTWVGVAGLSAAVLSFVCLSLACTILVYNDEAVPLFRAVRWAMRAALIAWTVGLAVWVWWEDRADRAVEPEGVPPPVDAVEPVAEPALHG